VRIRVWVALRIRWGLYVAVHRGAVVRWRDTSAWGVGLPGMGWRFFVVVPANSTGFVITYIIGNIRMGVTKTVPTGIS